MAIWLYLSLFFCCLLPLTGRAGETLAPGDASFFNERIRPILERHCFECHSHKSGKTKNGLTLDSRAGWVTGGTSGTAIVPGHPEKSLLVKAIQYTDPDLRMPPKQKLSDEEISLVEEWIQHGAPDPRVLAGMGTSAGPSREWWSLKPLVRPAIPPGAQHPIDCFVSAQLTRQNLSPAPEADRRTLIRRLTVDLHGLLPTEEEVEAFSADPDPAAYERLVDRLLASPRYGEHWARHWLDTVHFADTHGFEHDLMRTNAWRYRDYVIESLNRDTLWPRFIREQLAADVFYPNEPGLTAALGFLGAGPWDQSTAQTAPRNFEYLDRDDMVTQTVSTFASTTVHCARCHDHKFDPISQQDYYAFQAVFAGIGKGDLAYDPDPEVQGRRRYWQRLLADAQKGDRNVLLAEEDEARIEEWARLRRHEANWEIARPDIFVTSSSAWLRINEDGSLMAEGPRPDTDVYTLAIVSKLRALTGIRLEVLTDPTLPMHGPGRQDNGNFHLSEIDVRIFRPAESRAEKVVLRRATADFNQSNWTINHAVDGDEKTAWGIHPREGEGHVAVFELERSMPLESGAKLVVQLKQLHGQNHVIGKFRLSLTDDDPTRAFVLPTPLAEALQLPRRERTETQEVALVSFALQRRAEDELQKLGVPLWVFGAGPKFSAVAEGGFYKPWIEPKAVHVLKRGDINHPGEVAIPGALAAVTELSARFVAKNTQDEGYRRAALADWFADSRNALTWRSIVNRVWHYHFGRGLSDSLNDFGHMGSVPTHPELLDWLACEFRDQGGSVKKLHRLIVTSAAYRRANSLDPHGEAEDPDNRLLWRRKSQRLDAEAFRDSVLAIAGRLDLRMGGPGVQQFKLGKPIQLTPTVDYGPFDWSSANAGRRSIYRFVYRGLQDPFMDALDFPDAAQLAPARPLSTSPLQALALLNNDFVLQLSQQVADRLARMAPEPEGRIRKAFQLALQREPTTEEVQDFSAYAIRNGLPAMCRIFLNYNEFLFVD